MTNYLYTQVNPPQPNLHANPIDVAQPNTLESNVGELSPFELLTLGPGLSIHPQNLSPNPQTTTLWCEEHWITTSKVNIIKGSLRKRIRKEFGKQGRNIK